MSASASPVPDEPEKVLFGIDLGTLRSRAVTVKHDGGGFFNLKFVEDIPSVVTFTENDPSKCIVGSFAKVRIICTASNTFCVTKYLIGRDYEDPVVQEVAKNKVGYKILKSVDGRPCVMSSNLNQVFTPSHIAALILLKLKEFCEDGVKIPMKDVVITTPAYFTEIQVQATREAAQMAGLNVLKIIDEPTAAVLAHDGNENDKTVVVYDFGGTFKVSVVEVRNGETKVKSTVYDLFLGGDDFDNALVNYFVDELKRLTKVDCRKDLTTMQWLKIAAEDAKIDLSSFTEIKIDFYIMHIQQSPRRITLELKRSKFEELVVEFINKTIPLCHKALDDAKVSVSDIDKVYAIGGVSTIPKVKAIVEEIFGKAPYQNEHCNRKAAAAYGAALTAHIVVAAGLTDDNVTSVEIFPHLPIPVKETDKFNFKLIDEKRLNSYNEYTRETVLSTGGIYAIFTEKEADSRIFHRHTNRGDDEDEDRLVTCIKCHENLLRLRRNNTEIPMPEEFTKMCDFFRERRDDGILDRLLDIFGVIS